MVKMGTDVSDDEVMMKRGAEFFEQAFLSFLASPASRMPMDDSASEIENPSPRSGADPITKKSTANPSNGLQCAVREKPLHCQSHYTCVRLSFRGFHQANAVQSAMSRQVQESMTREHPYARCVALSLHFARPISCTFIKKCNYILIHE